jgi:hypothetical protein
MTKRDSINTATGCTTYEGVIKQRIPGKSGGGREAKRSDVTKFVDAVCIGAEEAAESVTTCWCIDATRGATKVFRHQTESR